MKYYLLLSAFGCLNLLLGINCPGDGEHKEIDPNLFKKQHLIYGLSVGFGADFKAKLSAVKTTDVPIDVQRIQEGMFAVVEGFNKCAITKAQYQEAVSKIFPSIGKELNAFQLLRDAEKKGQKATDSQLRKIRTTISNLFLELRSLADIAASNARIEQSQLRVESKVNSIQRQRAQDLESSRLQSQLLSEMNSPIKSMFVVVTLKNPLFLAQLRDQAAVVSLFDPTTESRDILNFGIGYGQLTWSTIDSSGRGTLSEEGLKSMFWTNPRTLDEKSELKNQAELFLTGIVTIDRLECGVKFVDSNFRKFSDLSELEIGIEATSGLASAIDTVFFVANNLVLAVLPASDIVQWRPRTRYQDFVMSTGSIEEALKGGTGKLTTQKRVDFNSKFPEALRNVNYFIAAFSERVSEPAPSNFTASFSFLKTDMKYFKLDAFAVPKVGGTSYLRLEPKRLGFLKDIRSLQ